MRPRLHWWHLLALVLLVTVVDVGRHLLAGYGWRFSLAVLPSALYAMGPLLAGVAISILEGGHRTAREAIKLGMVVVVGMLVMDLLTPPDLPRQDLSRALIRGEASAVLDGSLNVDKSWISVMREWSSDRLDLGDGFTSSVARTTDGDRNRVTQALGEGFFLLTVFAVLGMVLAAGRWIRGHVTFDRPGDRRAAHVVVAWLLAPLVVSLTIGWFDKQAYRANFEGASVWWVAFPFVVVFLLGVIAWNVDFAHPDGHEGDGP